MMLNNQIMLSYYDFKYENLANQSSDLNVYFSRFEVFLSSLTCMIDNYRIFERIYILLYANLIYFLVLPNSMDKFDLVILVRNYELIIIHFPKIKI